MSTKRRRPVLLCKLENREPALLYDHVMNFSRSRSFECDAFQMLSISDAIQRKPET